MAVRVYVTSDMTPRVSVWECSKPHVQYETVVRAAIDGLLQVCADAHETARVTSATVFAAEAVPALSNEDDDE
jgi:hypothetical protein